MLRIASMNFWDLHSILPQLLSILKEILNLLSILRLKANQIISKA